MSPEIAPNQEELDSLWRNTVRALIFDGGMVHGKPISKLPTFEVSEPAELDELRRLLQVHDGGDFACMCLGNSAVQLLDGENHQMATLGLHHGDSIRWGGWNSDANLVHPGEILTWLADRGLAGPLQEYEADKRRAVESESLAKSWAAAAPEAIDAMLPSILEFSKTGLVDPEIVNEAKAKMEASYPNTVERALALLRWNASGSGKCSGYPVHEKVPGDLLLTIETPTVIETIVRNADNLEAWQGAVRYFAGWDFRSRRSELVALTPHMRERLLAIAESSGDPDKIARAQKALQD